MFGSAILIVGFRANEWFARTTALAARKYRSLEGDSDSFGSVRVGVQGGC